MAVAGVIVYGLGQNTMYFRSPSDVAAKQVGEGVAFRLGGLVEKGSLQHGAGAEVQFRVTDGKSSVLADYNGVLPALFREGQGVVATGAVDAQGTFIASEVLAKHDEKYMPPEVVDALKRSGRWQEGAQ
jgi:cytochrome c-type biogenesis protein CcmE